MHKTLEEWFQTFNTNMTGVLPSNLCKSKKSICDFYYFVIYPFCLLILENMWCQLFF